MNPKYPVYIISKGRSNIQLTARELEMMKVPHKVVVEPQEYDDYCMGRANKQCKSWKPIRCDPNKILVLPFSNLNKGSIPARNWVWEHSISEGHDKHWILDDNIEGFHRMNRNMKPKVTSGTIFKCAEDFIDRYDNVPMSGFNYYSFCKNTDAVPPFYLNTRIYSCTLLDNSVPHRWRGRYNEDTDLSLRFLKDGYCTILFNAFIAGKVTTQKMRGGNTDSVYTDGDERLKFAKSLQKQHPDVVEVVWKFNRWHHQVNYKKFRNNRLKRKEGLKLKDEVDNYGMKLITIERKTDD